MKLMLKSFRILAEGIILALLMWSLWMLGSFIGSFGAAKYERVYVTGLGSFWQILFVVVEFSAGIWFFIALFRQLLPGGIKELLSGELTLAVKAKYLPGIFALGITAGLVINAVTFFVQKATSYMK